MFNCKVKDIGNIIILIIRYVYLPAHCRKKRIERECDKYLMYKEERRDYVGHSAVARVSGAVQVGGRLDCSQTKSL